MDLKSWVRGAIAATVVASPLIAGCGSDVTHGPGGPEKTGVDGGNPYPGPDASPTATGGGATQGGGLPSSNPAGNVEGGEGGKLLGTEPGKRPSGDGEPRTQGAP